LPAINKPFDKDRSGLVAQTGKNALKILMVAPGSPAERAGWKQGEELIAIDGHAIDAAYEGSPLARWGRQPAGTVVKLTKGDHSVHDLTLADYF